MAFRHEGARERGCEGTCLRLPCRQTGRMLGRQAGAQCGDHACFGARFAGDGCLPARKRKDHLRRQGLCGSDAKRTSRSQRRGMASASQGPPGQASQLRGCFVQQKEQSHARTGPCLCVLPHARRQGTSLWDHQTPLGLSEGQVSRSGEEHRPSVLLVCLGQHLYGTAGTGYSIATRASKSGAGGQNGRHRAHPGPESPLETRKMTTLST